MIKFSVSALEKSPVTIRGSKGVDFFDLDENDPLTISKDMDYELTGSKVSGGILIRGNCTTAVSGICGRCLENVEKIVNSVIEIYCVPDACEDELDISDDIREEVLLSLPINLLCDDNCAGLCRSCGGNLNRGECSCGGQNKSGDFRWSALDDLKL